MKALLTRLKWQLYDLSQKQLNIEQQLVVLEKKSHSIQQKIISSCIMPALIVPEHEMARSHFMTQQQQQQDELTLSKAGILSNQTALKQQQTRLNMELKMLEKHQEAKLNIQRQHALLTEQNNRDEWTLQRRELA